MSNSSNQLGGKCPYMPYLGRGQMSGGEHVLHSYKCTFFPHTIRDWNDLPDSLFSTAEMSGDYVYKFASLVRTRD